MRWSNNDYESVEIRPTDPKLGAHSIYEILKLVMPIYLLTPLANNAPQAAELVQKKVAEANRHPLPDSRGWLIVFKGTNVELCNHLGITGLPEGTPPALSSILVTSVGSYYGRAASTLWEWLKTRSESA